MAKRQCLYHASSRDSQLPKGAGANELEQRLLVAEGCGLGVEDRASRTASRLCRLCHYLQPKKPHRYS